MPLLLPSHPGPQTRKELNAFDELFLRCYPRASEGAMDVLLDALPVVDEGVVLSGEPAFNYMIELRQRMVDATVEAAQSYDSVTWLNLIRTLSPHALSLATIGTTEGEGDSTQRVAENLVGGAPGARLQVPAAQAPATAVMMRLARLMALAGMVDSLEGAVRSASKGVKYRVRNRRRPKPVESDNLRAALREFDLRGKWRTADDELRLNEVDNVDFVGDPPMLVSYRFVNGSAMDETWSGPYRSVEKVDSPVQFTARAFVTGNHLYAALGEHGALASLDDPEAAAALVIFGHALLEFVLQAAPDAGRTIPYLGTLSLSRDLLDASVQVALDRAKVRAWLTANGQGAISAAEVTRRVEASYQVGRRSFPGPILHDDGSDVLVDVWAMAWHVTHDLKITAHGGRLANLTGEHFELFVQELIDASVLAPPKVMRDLRGKVLRLDGRAVTDVDAILVSGATLFLISCKRFLTPVDYLAGENKAYKNGMDRVNKALDQWRDRVETFRNSPKGDNYDFTGYTIEGFVLLPELVFTPRSDSREKIRFGTDDLFFTRLENFGQFAAVLEMASWPKEPPALRWARLSGN
ncbi:hypothetical protein NS206_09770 [Microbacterium testaceum]|uniref:hypothetical protein n=1 Tax=Microbacterium testaceum TaxID=2033 RepID=UPI0007341335|nr:hypothetical protein [Microbacterium testaceum]KTS62936.1 hypothetical protein NS206_09770 [Microbacterium testaceum]